MKNKIQKIIDELEAELKSEDTDYAYPTIEEYEKLTGYKVNEGFTIGWDMARITNKMLGIKETE